MTHALHPVHIAMFAFVLGVTGCGDEVVGPDASEALGPCDGFENDPDVETELLVVNDGAEPIYVIDDRFSAPDIDFEVLDPSTGEPLDTGPEGCSCERSQEDANACTFSFGGSQLAILAIPPGQTRTLTWDGRAAEETTMPSQCFADQLNEQSACRIRVRPPAGAYPVRITVHTEVTGCYDAMGMQGPCACDDPMAACSLQADEVMSTETVLEGTLDLGGTDRATVTFTGT